MNKCKKIVSDIDNLTEELSLPLTQSEIDCGWTPESQNATLKLLAEIRKALLASQTIEKVNLGRGLDSWGGLEGTLFERACTISNDLFKVNDE